MNWDNPACKILGLNKTEKKILGSIESFSSVQQIAKVSGISRTGINYALEALIQKGLVKLGRNKARKTYQAINSTELAEAFLESSRKVDLLDYLKEQTRLKSAGNQKVRIHLGLNEVIAAYFSIVNTSRDERVRAIQHHRSFLEIIEKLTPPKLVEFNRIMHKHKIILDGMLNKGAYKSTQEEIAREPEKYKPVAESLGEDRIADYTVFPDQFFNYDAELWLFRNTALIINWKEEIAVEIDNEHITGFLRDMFKFVKACNLKLDHHRVLREVLQRSDL